MKKVNLMILSAMALLTVSCSKPKDTPDDLLPNTGDNSNLSLPSGPGDVVGKVTVGYQGWFSASGDGSPINGWAHMNLESWPDVREYTNTYSGTPFNQAGVGQPGYTGNLGNGQPAKMFSSDNQQVANTHCLWMQQNGIDCIALQRFGSYLIPGAVKNFHDDVDVKMKNAAQTYGRKFYIMYDCSATDPTVADWTNNIVNTQHLTSSTAYAKQNGKPVVCLWGVGKSGRGTTANWVTMINALKNLGCYVIGGPLAGFATDTPNQPAYNACNMIMPWMVGKTSASNFQGIYAADLAYCNAHNIDYQADIYPGTAFYNTNGASSPKNQISRNRGDFMWKQFAAAKQAGVQSVYISMFDELNEATQIMKTAEDASMVPAGKYFLNMDADGTHISSDFYLRLTNDGGKMIKGQIPYTATKPTPYVVSSSAIANGTYKIVSRNSGLALDAQGNLTANGTPIQQWSYSGGNNQRWTVTSIGGGQYKIIGVASGRSLDVTGNTTTDGAAIQLYDYHNGGGQNWVFTATSGGYYTIKSAGTGKVLDVTGNSTAPGALIHQWTSSGGNNQQWAFQAP